MVLAREIRVYSFSPPLLTEPVPGLNQVQRHYIYIYIYIYINIIYIETLYIYRNIIYIYWVV